MQSRILTTKLTCPRYFEDILRNTSSSTTQVAVEPNGRWFSASEKKTGVKDESPDDDDSDGDLRIVNPVKRERDSLGGASNLFGAQFAAPTPPRPSPSVASAASGARGSNKRKSEVIDLTLSDDDEPVRKRPAYSTPSSLPDQGQRPNGYPSFSTKTIPTDRTNAPLRFQMNRGDSSSHGGSSSNGTHPTYSSSSDHNHRASYGTATNGSTSTLTSFHRPSPLGTALAPINLSESPPHRPPSSLAAYSAHENFGIDQPRRQPPPTLPHFDYEDAFSDNPEFSSPPPRSPAFPENHSAYGTNVSEQRAILRSLANPFSDRRSFNERRYGPGDSQISLPRGA